MIEFSSFFVSGKKELFANFRFLTNFNNTVIRPLQNLQILFNLTDSIF